MTFTLTDDTVKEISSRIGETFYISAFYDFAKCSQISVLKNSLERGETKISIEDDLSGQEYPDLVYDHLICEMYEECVLYRHPIVVIQYNFTVNGDGLDVEAHVRAIGNGAQSDPIFILDHEALHDVYDYLFYEFDCDDMETVEEEKEKLFARLEEEPSPDTSKLKIEFRI